MVKQYRIYMDACCFNRPFDDWTQSRIRIEAEAVLAIAARCQTEEWCLIRSTALEVELDRIPDLNKKQRVLDFFEIAKIQLSITEAVLNRAAELTTLKFQPFDALHIACAETVNADIFLTTDDRLICKAVSYSNVLSVEVMNPVNWVMKVLAPKGEANDDSN